MTTTVTEMRTVQNETNRDDLQIIEKVKAIRASWSAEERAERALVGLTRRCQLADLLFGPGSYNAA